MTNAKILVADDDRNICELLRMYLEKEGFSAVLAFDGEDALAKFDEENPDLILLDVMMPRLDGWQVCRELRKKSECPIIMITAKGETFDKILGLELGADDYISKPFDTLVVKQRVANTIAQDENTEKKENCSEECFPPIFFPLYSPCALFLLMTLLPPQPAS